MVSVDAAGDDGVGYRSSGSASDKLPELQGHVVMRESGKRGWRKAFAFLRGSGFYVSSKGEEVGKVGKGLFKKVFVDVFICFLLIFNVDLCKQLASID